MKFQIHQTFDDYVDCAHKTVKEILSENCYAIQGIRIFYELMSSIDFDEDVVISPISGVLIMNAHMIFLSGAHTAMQGHAAAVFPLLRTALENACYAFLIARDSKLQHVWLNRHNSKKALRESRNSFSSAVRKVADAINIIQPDSGNIVLECYESAVDFGAHPNPRGIVGHIEISGEAIEGEVAVWFSALHSSDAFETRRSLIACLDFSFAIALVMARLRSRPNATLLEGLARMNEIKAAAIKEFGFLDRRER